jgi:hypothetical protein
MHRVWSGGRPAIPTACLLLVVGCGGHESAARLYPVRGTVTLEDGSPLTRGMVVFEAQAGGAAVTARGVVKADGSYELSTRQTGDGVPPGKYRVQINPMDHRSEVPDEEKNLPYDIKYTKFETSGLEYEVKPGPNGYSIRLARALDKAESNE